MRFWPFGKVETRSGGSYTDAIVQAIEAQAVATVADASATAAIEAVAGLLSRTLSAARVDGPTWLQDAVNPPWLAMVGRSLVREGASLSVIRATEAALHLVPAAHWTFETLNGEMLGEVEDEWQARVTTYGPSASTTRTLSRDGFVYVRWGASPGTPYRGRGPVSWAHLTAKMNGETERSLGDEAAGPIAQLLSIPADGGDDDDKNDPLAKLKADVKAARGKALFIETTQAGWSEGKAAAPQRDWMASRLGPNPPEALVKLADVAFMHMVAACGASSALFDDSDGTSKREALRQWHMGTVAPMVDVLRYELRKRLETDVRIVLDDYPRDLAGRAQAFKNLVAGGMDADRALAVSGLMVDDAAQ